MVLEASGHSMYRLRWVKVRRWLRSSAALPTKHPPVPSGGGEGLWRFQCWFCVVRVPTWPVIRTPFESSLTSSPRNRCIECPDASKTIGNQLPVKKCIGAVLRKSSQLELVAEIGPFENPLFASKNQRKYIEKLVLKKTTTICSALQHYQIY